MEYVTLGRTGLRVSRAGLGAGGHSRLGQGTGRSIEQSVAVLRRALELGVNVIDTAEVYGTEPIIARALRDVPRDRVVLSTKKNPYSTGLGAGLLKRLRGRPPMLSAMKWLEGLEASLWRLGTDHVDIFHLHGLTAAGYDRAVETLLPVMERARRQGKIRAIGVTERFEQDPAHRMLRRAVADGHFDVVMVGFNLLNPSARHAVLADAREKDIGVLNMFAVRRALSQPERLRELVRELVRRNEVDGAGIDADDPLGWLISDGQARDLPDAAYRFCRHEPGVHVVLFGTGNPAHVDANVESMLRPPLPEPARRRLKAMLGDVASVSGQ